MIRYFLVLLLLTCSVHVYGDERVLNFPRFGKLTVYDSEHPQNVVLFLSGEEGWNKGVSEAAKALASQGAMVIGIDIRHYLQQLRISSKGCAYPAADLEDVSKFVQKSYDSAVYKIPYLTGYSAGATLAYVALAQAPSNTFAGAVGMNFCPELKILKSFCKGKGLESVHISQSGTYRFLPAKLLDQPWITLQGSIPAGCHEPSIEKYNAQVRGGRFVKLPGTISGDSIPKEWMTHFIEEFSNLYAARKPDLHPFESIVSSPEVKDLPLIELPVANASSKTLAVIVSGDGGWASIDREIGDYLSQKGIPVVGWNSLQYFWKKRTADGSAKDLQRILQHYLTTWKKDNAILIGYSFGADVLPFMVNRLPADLQKKIKSVSLLGLDTKADFEFHVSDWINASSSTASPTQPELAKIKGPRILCFYGESETDSLCSVIDPKIATRILLSGGHHFGGDYQGIAMRILSESSL
jgi:type IV secretory pathway VirJ component